MVLKLLERLNLQIAMESNFTFIGGFSGPAAAAVLTVEMILALIANGVVLSITLYQRKSLKQPSTIFFTSLILAHLVLTLLYLPFTIIGLAAEEWIFGSTDEEKTGTCNFVAFIFWFSNAVMSFTLVAISFDRFLFIVKPHLHKRFMRPWVALTLTIAIWLLSVVLGAGPFIDIGYYGYDNDIGYCDISNIDFVAVGILLVIIFLVVGIIFVTSLLTFCFTRSFFKAQSVIAGESVYASKKKRLFGIFGSMLLIYGICFVPGFLYYFFYLFIDLPASINILSIFVLIGYIFITVASPIIQSYFRPEIKSVLASRCPLLFNCVCCSCLHAVC